MLLAGVPLPAEKKGANSKNKNHKDWVRTAAYSRFLELYQRLLREEVIPALVSCGEEGSLEAVVQSTPVLRVVMPSAHVATKRHRDADYGHIPEELNYWVPLTPVWGSNSLFVETFPGRGDFTPFEGSAGEMFRWWGNQCEHFVVANSTDGTRVSFDFRVVPRRLWDAAEATRRVADTALNRLVSHLGELRIGSYYALEHATCAARIEDATSPTGVAAARAMPAAECSGDGSLANVGIRVHGVLACYRCRQRFDSTRALEVHARIMHEEVSLDG